MVTMRGTQIGLAMVLVSICFEGIMVVESKTANREMDGYEHSGYAWPKTILWRGIRSSPGVLWFYYFFLVYGMFTTLFLNLMLKAYAKFVTTEDVSEGLPSNTTVTDTIGGLIGSIQSLMIGGSLIYVSLALTTLSDVMEAYLVGMVSIQVVMSTPRIAGNEIGRWIFMSAFQLSAVFGIAMLDSYHALNVLNTTYSAVGGVMIVILVCTERAPARLRTSCDSILAFMQMGFSIAALLLALAVEGTHRKPMVTILGTACAYTGIEFLTTLCCAAIPDEDESSEDQPSPPQMRAQTV